ncbi:MAG: peroxiredoxin [Steroidobacteraceae bacterium]
MLARSASTLNFRHIALGLLLFALTALALAADAPGAGPEIGQAAPAIRLQDQHGNWVTLDQQKGKWVVLYFYPKDNTPGCTTQACEFRDNIFEVRKANAVILGVSVDDLASHQKFSQEHGLPFSILADSTKETSTRYGVLMKRGNMEIANRVTYLIDPQGKIAKRYVVDPPSLAGHSKAVLADIASLSGKKAG